MNTEIDRKIAVIFVADVVGYSKHMEMRTLPSRVTMLVKKFLISF